MAARCGDIRRLKTAESVLGALFPEVKRPEHVANHSSPSSAEVKNAWNYTSTPSYVLIAWCFIKRRVCLHGMILSTRATSKTAGLKFM
jgi:hypothetical protein